MSRFGFSRFWTVMFLVASIAVLPVTAMAATVVLDVTGYGYNTISGSGNGADGNPGAIGCGPTSGAMILEYWTRHGALAPGPVTNAGSLADARAMGGAAYMNVSSDGFGTPSNFQFGLESFASSRGYDVNAVLHVNSTDPPAGWAANGYNAPADIAFDVNFWNTTTWQVKVPEFMTFIKAEIDAGRPLVATVDSDGYGYVNSTGFYQGDDHWMVMNGYNDVTNQWAGYNTWDGTQHWFDIASAFGTGLNYGAPNGGHSGSWVTSGGKTYWAGDFGTAFGISYLRTFEFLGPFAGTDPDPDPGGGGSTVPEPGTMLLLGSGLVGLVGYGRRHLKK